MRKEAISLLKCGYSTRATSPCCTNTLTARSIAWRAPAVTMMFSAPQAIPRFDISFATIARSSGSPSVTPYPSAAGPSRSITVRASSPAPTRSSAAREGEPTATSTASRRWRGEAALVGVSREIQDHRFVSTEYAAACERSRGRHDYAPRRLHEQTLGAGDELAALENVGVRDRRGGAAAFTDRRD